jgi:hypothetical protein
MPPQAGQVSGTPVGPRDGRGTRDGLLERGIGSSATSKHGGTNAGWDAMWNNARELRLNAPFVRTSGR